MTFIEFGASWPLAGSCFNNVSTVHPDGFMEVGEGVGDEHGVLVVAVPAVTPPAKKKRSSPSGQG